MQLSESRPDTLNPVLFMQSVDSFMQAEIAAIDATNAGVVAAAPAATQPNSTPGVRPLVAAPIAPDAAPHEQIVVDAVRRAVDAWVAAWSAKDLQRYLQSYTEGFTGSQGSHNAWVENRTSALNKPGDIEVSLSNFEIVTSGNEVIAHFDQAYRSANYSDQVRKTLIYEFAGNRWLISSEQSTPIN